MHHDKHYNQSIRFIIPSSYVSEWERRIGNKQSLSCMSSVSLLEDCLIYGDDDSVRAYPSGCYTLHLACFKFLAKRKLRPNFRHGEWLTIIIIHPKIAFFLVYIWIIIVPLIIIHPNNNNPKNNPSILGLLLLNG